MPVVRSPQASQRLPPFFQSSQKPLILGHRGVPEDHQENTMAGFERAIELGLDGVELDVFLTKDHQLVVFHDLDTERLTGVPSIITDLTWSDVQHLTIRQTLDVGDKVIDYGREERIVLLEHVLEETRGQLLVNIEIKADNLDFGQRHTGTAVAHLIRRMGVESAVFVTSFNLWPLIWLERTYPRIESGLIYSPLFNQNKGLRWLMESNLMGKLMGSTVTSMSLNLFDADTIERVHQRGLAIGAWTVFSQNSKWLGESISAEQELNSIHDLTARGLDFFITDDPVRLRQVLSQP